MLSGQFVQYYNHERYHESLDNITPAEICILAAIMKLWIEEPLSNTKHYNRGERKI